MSDIPPDDVYQALGHRPNCLTALAISELAANLRSPTPVELAHLQTCEPCAADLADEKREVDAAQREAVSTTLLRIRPRFRRRQMYAALAGVMTLSLLVFISRQPAEKAASMHLKGGTPVLVTVVEDGKQQQTDTPIEQLEKVPENAQLVIRLGAPGVRYVRIESREKAGWEELFRGATSADGELPNSLRLTAGPTHLRVTVCDDAAFAVHCEGHVVDL